MLKYDLSRAQNGKLDGLAESRRSKNQKVEGFLIQRFGQNSPEVNCPCRSAWQAASALACVAADELIFQQAFFNGMYPAGQFIGFGGVVFVSSCDLSLEQING